MGRAKAAHGLVLGLTMILAACGGAQKPSAPAKGAESSVAAEEPRRSCDETCALVATCGGPCDCDGSPLFVCLSSADTCAEVNECRAP